MKRETRTMMWTIILSKNLSDIKQSVVNQLYLFAVLRSDPAAFTQTLFHRYSISERAYRTRATIRSSLTSWTEETTDTRENL